MIENQRQYDVTKRNISSFERTIVDLELNHAGHSPRSILLMRAEYQEQLDRLRAELAEYEQTQAIRRSA
ncbi:MAG: hypothetical protein NTZ05_21330 [Chloroflexi bacterium]|nr:hypothetical protein [Chloroflexota bacterium]